VWRGHRTDGNRRDREGGDMIEDANALPSGSSINVDLCIVGAGAAGISLALQFIGSGRRVLLVESGGRAEESATQDLYRGQVANEALHNPPNQYRHRLFGGSTLTWGGRCVPFDRIDFEDRPWMPHSGWPIAYDEVARYYPAANALCEAGDFIYAAAAAVDGGMRPMIKGFVPRDFSCDAIERFSCPTHFGARYGHRLEASADVRVLLNANAVTLVQDATGTRIKAVTIRTLAGKQFEVVTVHIVLATGGLETARLLLASRSCSHPNGIGNARDLVGRYYMCHIAGTIGEVTFTVPSRDIWHGYDRAWDGVYCRRRMALLPEAQRRLEVGNAVFRLHHPRLADPAHRSGILSLIYLAKPFISYEYARRLHGAGRLGAATYLKHILNVARDPFGTAGFLANWAWVRILAARKFPSLVVVPRTNVYSIDVHGEQAPNPQSRVTLSDDRDPLEMPRLHIDWRYSPCDIRTVAEGLKQLQSEFAAFGRASLHYTAGEVESCMLREGAYGGHHIGTARMSCDPDTGVVDPDCRVHGINNLYIASSAVFPTSGQANPTLTIVALTLRLADHLKKRLEPPGGA
jgi:choline dehydrogenase-like flavoprotein